MPGSMPQTNPSIISTSVTKPARTSWRKELLKPEKAVSMRTRSPRIFLRKCKYRPPTSGPHKRKLKTYALTSVLDAECDTLPTEPAAPRSEEHTSELQSLRH